MMSETNFAILGSIAVMFLLLIGFGAIFLKLYIQEEHEHQAFLKEERKFKKRMLTKKTKSEGTSHD